MSLPPHPHSHSNSHSHHHHQQQHQQQQAHPAHSSLPPSHPSSFSSHMSMSQPPSSSSSGPARQRGIDLEHVWDAWLDPIRSKLVHIDQWKTIQDYWRFFNTFDTTYERAGGCHFLIFKENVLPNVDDPSNAYGGRVSFQVEVTRIKSVIVELTMAVVGEVCDADFISGILVCRSLNGLEHTVQVWTSTSNDDIVNALIKQLRSLAGLPPHGKCTFDRHRKEIIGNHQDKQIPQKRDPTTKCVYDRDFLRRLALSEGSLRAPTRFARVDWESLPKKTSVSPSPSTIRRFSWPKGDLDPRSSLFAIRSFDSGAVLPRLDEVMSHDDLTGADMDAYLGEAATPAAAHMHFAHDDSLVGSETDHKIARARKLALRSPSPSIHHQDSITAAAGLILPGTPQSRPGNRPPRSHKNSISQDPVEQHPGGAFDSDFFKYSHITGRRTSAPALFSPFGPGGITVPAVPVAVEHSWNQAEDEKRNENDPTGNGASVTSPPASSPSAANSTGAATGNAAKPKVSVDDDNNATGTARGPDTPSTGVLPMVRRPPQHRKNVSFSKAAFQTMDLSKMTSTDVEEILAHLTDFYTMELVHSHQLTPIVSDILSAEGCAQCLLQDLSDRGMSQPGTPHGELELNGTDKDLKKGGLGSISEEDSSLETTNADEKSKQVKTQRGPYVVLCCKLLHCKHVIHLSCIVKLHRRSYNRSQLIQQAPSLEACHCTSFFRVIAFPPNTPKVSMSAPNDPSGQRRCMLELAMTHHISNAQLLRISWPATLSTLLDTRSNKEYLFLTLNTFGDPPEPKSESGNSDETTSTTTKETSIPINISKLKVDVNSPALPSVNEGATGTSTSTSTASPYFASFAVARGQLHFRCTDRSTGEIWQHTCNYDLSPLTPNTNIIKLVLVDSQTRNILTIGVHRLQFGEHPPPSLETLPAGTVTPKLGRGFLPAEPVFALSYVKYEFCARVTSQAGVNMVPMSAPSPAMAPVPSTRSGAASPRTSTFSLGRSAMLSPQHRIFQSSPTIRGTGSAAHSRTSSFSNSYQRLNYPLSMNSPNYAPLLPSDLMGPDFIPALQLHPGAQTPGGMMGMNMGMQMGMMGSMGRPLNHGRNYSDDFDAQYLQALQAATAQYDPLLAAQNAAAQQQQQLQQQQQQQQPQVQMGGNEPLLPTGTPSPQHGFELDAYGHPINNTSGAFNPEQGPSRHHQQQVATATQHAPLDPMMHQQQQQQHELLVINQQQQQQALLLQLEQQQMMQQQQMHPSHPSHGMPSKPPMHHNKFNPNQPQHHPHHQQQQQQHHQQNFNTQQGIHPHQSSHHQQQGMHPHQQGQQGQPPHMGHPGHHQQQQQQQQQQHLPPQLQPQGMSLQQQQQSQQQQNLLYTQVGHSQLQAQQALQQQLAQQLNSQGMGQAPYYNQDWTAHLDGDHKQHKSRSRSGSSDNGSGEISRRGSADSGDQSGSPNTFPSMPAPPQMPSGAPILNLTPDQVIGNVVRLAKSHSGSRFVQQKLDARDPTFFKMFYDEMKDHVPDLMIDNFGHFAIEKLIALCDEDQILILLQRLAPSISMVACQKHGSFSVQALVDTLHTPAQIYVLVEALRPDIVRIITHASGHFVVLRMLQRFPYQSTKFIDDAIQANCAQIGTDHHGLRVVKAVLAVRRAPELTRLFKQVARLTMKLVENQYGNYVIQSVLDVAPPGVRTNIKVKMEGKYMRLSKQKFSSNVVEKCLKQSSSHWRTIIIRELTAQPAVAELLRDRYGNYVLQTALSVANASQVTEILRSITPHLSSLRDNVRSKWKKMLKKAGSGQQMGAPSGISGPASPPPSMNPVDDLDYSLDSIPPLEPRLG